MGFREHAISEFRAAGWLREDGSWCDKMQQMMCEDILELLDVFSKQGHSGSSAPYAVNLFDKLARFKNITPLTGEDSEWNEVGPGVFQNNRLSSIFKDRNKFNGQAYSIDAIVFWEWYADENGERHKSYYTNSDSRQVIEFPYTPPNQPTYIFRPTE